MHFFGDRENYCVKVNEVLPFMRNLNSTSQRLKGSVFYGEHSERADAKLREQPKIYSHGGHYGGHERPVQGYAAAR